MADFCNDRYFWLILVGESLEGFFFSDLIFVRHKLGSEVKLFVREFSGVDFATCKECSGFFMNIFKLLGFLPKEKGVFFGCEQFFLPWAEHCAPLNISSNKSTETTSR